MTAENAVKSDTKKVLFELFAVSFLSLFIELMFVRWMSADVRAFSIFKTFPLVACFIGLGVGCARGNDRWFAWSPLLVFLSAIVVKFLLPQTGLDMFLPANLASFNWEPRGLVATLPHTIEFMVFLAVVLALPFFTMACLGSRIGVLFNKSRPLVAYAADISGALCGSITAAVGSFLCLDPSFLLGCAVVLISPLVVRNAQRKLIPAVAIAAALFSCFWSKPLPPWEVSLWSPYQHLTLKIYTDNPKAAPKDAHKMYWLLVNGRSYQACWNQHLLNHPLFSGWLQPYWSRCITPYRLTHPKDVAIVAAGMGMDVQAALVGGAQRIDAVDIDPLILRLGKQLNPEHPYDSPKVTARCDDARHFFMTTPKKYDLVVFSHLDSQTVLGESSSVRLDNFVYTKESFERALKLLKDDGLLFVCFNAQKDWFRDRVYKTLWEASGYQPLIFRDKRDVGGWSFFCLSGPLVRDHKITLPPDLPSIASRIQQNEQTRILTDDWPYLYVKAVSVDWTYLLVAAEILGVAFIAGRKLLFSKTTSVRAQLFFLGAAFLLLELQSISRLSLLYGTTWLTSALVINGVLVMILLANLLTIRFKQQLTKRLTLLYVLLFLSLAASYLLPVQTVLAWNAGETGKTLISTVTLLPIFFAGLIFPTSFAMDSDSAVAFAFNLCGSTIGAIVEYQSNFTGINSLVLLSAALYFVSFVSLKAPQLMPFLGRRTKNSAAGVEAH